VQAPDGYELTGATGPTLESSDVQPKSIVLHVTPASARKHQFLISMVRAVTDARAEVPLLSFSGAQRETGEVLVEGEGAVELVAKELGGLRRMDLKETSPYLRSLARAPLHAAFRYQRRPAETPAVALSWVRFPDSAVLSAVAQQAVVTTLVTSEGRSLTEVKLTVKNQAQPFLKVALPAGATILSAEVAGEKVKPVQGADGNRVPLLKTGFRPKDAYTVSYVFLHAGAPFGKKGGAELALPRMDVPIGLVEWEVFLPQRYKVADFGGQTLSARLLPPSGEEVADAEVLTAGEANIDSLAPGQVGGVVTDSAGAVISKATVTLVELSTGVTRSASTDLQGRWVVTDVPSGRFRVTAVAPGFNTNVRIIDHIAERGSRLNLDLNVGSTAQTITVMAETVPLNTSTGQVSVNNRYNRQKETRDDLSASANVMDLQRRVSGVLPIAVNVPRTGSSYRFVRPLVVDEETRLTFSYRSGR
jgi:hypothetical protein